MPKSRVKVGIHFYHNKTCRDKWFLGLSRNCPTLRRTQALPTGHLYHLQCINHISTHAHKMATTVPNSTFSCHMTVSKAVKKRKAKALSYHLFLLERAQTFPQKPPTLFLLSHWPELGHFLNSGCKKGLREKNRAFFCLILASGLCQVGRAGGLCLSTKSGETGAAWSRQAKGGKFADLHSGT